MRKQGVFSALEYYVKKSPDLIDSKFLYRELNKYQIIAKNDPETKFKFKILVQDNVKNLVISYYKILADRSSAYEVIKSIEDFSFNENKIHYLE